MGTLRRFALTAVVVGCLCQPLIALTQVPPPARDYKVVTLTLGGSNCEVKAIRGGMVVGEASTPGDAASHAFVWGPRTGIIDIGTLGGSRSLAFGTDGTQVVGASLIAGDAEFHAFRWTAAEGMQDLGTLGGTYGDASGVSGKTVVGTSAIASGELHAFAWTQATGMVDLGTLGGDESLPVQIHRGLIAGSSTTPIGPMRRPVAWLPDRQIVDIANEPFELDANGVLLATGEATGVRNGRVVGYRVINAPFGMPTLVHAFMWTPTRGAVDLGVIPGYTESFALATDGRLVVGLLAGGDAVVGFVQKPFVWSARTGMIDIGQQMPPVARATHVTAGRVVGYFVDPAGAQGVRTFLWTAARGAVDVTPASIRNATPAGIDARGRIAVNWFTDQDGVTSLHSAVLIPRKH